jgi:hypothetical protein
MCGNRAREGALVVRHDDDAFTAARIAEHFNDAQIWPYGQHGELL